jgi:hypothetical protein
LDHDSVLELEVLRAMRGLRLVPRQDVTAIE